MEESNAQIITTLAALRDVVVVLLAYEAQRSGHPVYSLLSEGLDRRIDTSGISNLEFTEGVRVQIERIIASAQSIKPSR